MGSHQFSLIDPTRLDGWASYVSLAGPLYFAAYWFAASGNRTKSQYEKATLDELSEVLAFAEAEAARYDDGDEQPPLELTIGASFIDALQERDDAGELPYSLTLVSRRSVGELEILCALVLWQCEKAARFIKSRNAIAATVVMWDIHELVNEANAILDRRDEAENAQKRAVALNKKRHEQRHRARALVCAEWERAPNAFPSAERAGNHFSQWIAGQGHPYEPRTVTSWIREHAKQLGIRFR